MDLTHYWSLQTWLHFTPPIESTTSATCNNQGITQDSDAVLLCDKMSGDEDELSLRWLAILHSFKCALLIAAIRTPWFFSWYLYREHTKLFFLLTSPPIWNNCINHTFTQSPAVYCKKKTNTQTKTTPTTKQNPTQLEKKQVLVLSLNSLGQAFLQYILTCHRAEGKSNRVRQVFRNYSEPQDLYTSYRVQASCSPLGSDWWNYYSQHTSTAWKLWQMLSDAGPEYMHACICIYIHNCIKTYCIVGSGLLSLTTPSLSHGLFFLTPVESYDFC